MLPLNIVSPYIYDDPVKVNVTVDPLLCPNTMFHISTVPPLESVVVLKKCLPQAPSFSTGSSYPPESSYPSSIHLSESHSCPDTPTPLSGLKCTWVDEELLYKLKTTGLIIDHSLCYDTNPTLQVMYQHYIHIHEIHAKISDIVNKILWPRELGKSPNETHIIGLFVAKTTWHNSYVQLFPVAEGCEDMRGWLGGDIIKSDLEIKEEDKKKSAVKKSVKEKEKEKETVLKKEKRSHKKKKPVASTSFPPLLVHHATYTFLHLFTILQMLSPLMVLMFVFWCKCYITFKVFNNFVEQNFSSKITLSTVLMLLFTITENVDLLNLHQWQQDPQLADEKQFWTNSYGQQNLFKIKRCQVWHTFIQESVHTIAQASNILFETIDNVSIGDLTYDAFSILGKEGGMRLSDKHACSECTHEHKVFADLLPVANDPAAVLSVDENWDVPWLVAAAAEMANSVDGDDHMNLGWSTLNAESTK
ncbi:hypothetical protein BYT27DRAFT_7225430 [Phlegmacium glaucopus]|nr:hypothetical protein BYT27DRAFT_7225430 [Phlegmacium glaucopus]